MGRKSKKVAVTDEIRDYLQRGEQLPPDQCILDVKHVAQVIGVSRTSLYKYGLVEEIRAAAKRQQADSNLPPSDSGRTAWRTVIERLRTALSHAEQRNKALLVRLQFVEANAARLGIDPEQLYKPLPKPDRSVAKTGHKAKQ